MKNTTISLDETLLEEARVFAKRLGLSFNAWVSRLIGEAVQSSPETSMIELMKIAETIKGSSNGRKWSREDAYE